MRHDTRISPLKGPKSCVLALHCSLGSSRQWAELANALDGSYQVFAPDLVEHRNRDYPFNLPSTLSEEVDLLSEAVERIGGPIHLVGHSYGGAIAFKAATCSSFANRIRSLVLMEPVLPTLLLDNEADRRLHDGFKSLAADLQVDLWNGQFLEAIDKFVSYWNGSGPAEQPSPETRLRMIEHAEELAFNFRAVLEEGNVAAAAAAIRVPTLLMSGGLSPLLTQRVVQRLACLIAGSEARHFRGASHMLARTHRLVVNAQIMEHIARADDLHARSRASARPQPVATG
jgi:pimeloyl-ACP methyl ester carboxylesterase